VLGAVFGPKLPKKKKKSLKARVYSTNIFLWPYILSSIKSVSVFSCHFYFVFLCPLLIQIICKKIENKVT